MNKEDYPVKRQCSDADFQAITYRQATMLKQTRRVHKQYRTDGIFSKAGFTLVEAMIVVAIIGILSAIATPLILQWLPNIRVKAATQQLYSDMQRARSLAIKNNTTVTVTFAVNVGCTGATSYTFTDSAGNVVVNQAMQDKVCMKMSTFTNGVSGFTSTGIPAGGAIGGTVTISHPQSTHDRTVKQTTSGSLRMQ